MTSTRREVLSALAAVTIALPLTTKLASADSALIELEWRDLVPSGGGIKMQRLIELGVVQHGQLDTPFEQEAGAEFTDAYDGKLVRIPGYLIPLDFSGMAVKSFLLVPYVGACIHVPPPPANQLIFVTTDTPYESAGLFEPVFVTGIFGAAATETQLADVGYSISAKRIEPYG